SELAIGIEPMTSPLPRVCSTNCATRASFFLCSAHDHETDRAGDGARTRDIKLGRLALYQLSCSRDLLFTPMKNRRFRLWFAQPRAHGGGRIRTFEGVSRQIYSLLPLAAWVPHRSGGLTARRLVRQANKLTCRFSVSRTIRPRAT